MALSPGFRIKNCTQFPLTISLDHAGPLYYGLVQSGEIFQRDTGAVWFTIKASISADNVCHIDDWDCVMPVVAIVGSVLVGAITGGTSAFAGVGASIGASALVSGGAVTMSSIVVPGVVAGGLTAGTAGAALGKIFSDGCDVKEMGCYAGPPWPFREAMPEYSVTGGPVAFAQDGKLVLEKGPDLAIVKGLMPLPPPPQAKITSTASTNELHVCGVTSDGHLWHAIRYANGSWSPFGDVEGQTGDRGSIVEADCALVAGELHVFGVASDGHLWHAIRSANGSWSPFGDVEGQAGDRGSFVSVGTDGVNGELHVCGVAGDGHLWHAIRYANGSWSPFGDVEGQAGDRGSFDRVAVGSDGDALHVAGVTSDGRLWHTTARNSWADLGDVESQTGDRGSFVTVSVTSD